MSSGWLPGGSAAAWPVSRCNYPDAAFHPLHSLRIRWSGQLVASCGLHADHMVTLLLEW